MRFDRLTEVSYKSINGVDVELKPMTVLYGPNGAGKTNLLEAIALGLGEWGPLRPVTVRLPRAPQETRSEAMLWLRAGDEDWTSLKMCLLAEWTVALGGDIDGQPDDALDHPRPHEVFARYRAQAVAALARNGEPSFAELVVDHAQVFYWYGRWHLQVSSDDLDSSGLRLAAAAAESASTSQKLRSIATELATGGSALLWDELLWRAPEPIWATFDATTLEQIILSTIGVASQGPSFSRPGSSRQQATSAVMHDAAHAIAHVASRLMPNFAAAEGWPQIELQEGPSRSPQVRIFLGEDSEGSPLPLADAGEGIRRWVSIALQLACREVDRWGITLAARSPGLSRGMDRVVLLVDEPEAHLHPRALDEVAAWLLSRSREGCTVFVSTHSEHFLRLPSDEVAIATVTKLDGTTRVRSIHGVAATAIGGVASEMGLTPVSLLSLHNMLLFVEGEQDKFVLDEMAGAQLAAAGVYVIPLGGTAVLKTKSRLAQLAVHLVKPLGLRVGVLTDNTRDIGDSAESHEEHIMKSFRLAAASVGLRIEPFGLSKRDVTEYLDEEVCRQVAPQFPGWEAARNEHDRLKEGKAKNLSHFKAWVRDRYQLGIDDPETVRELARLCVLNGRLPYELLTAVARICEVAATPHSQRDAHR